MYFLFIALERCFPSVLFPVPIVPEMRMGISLFDRFILRVRLGVNMIIRFRASENDYDCRADGSGNDSMQ